MRNERPPISWYGGKHYIVDYILDLIPPHTCFVEPFGGSGIVLFGKDPSKVDVYNDINEWLVSLYRMIRDNPTDLINYLECVPYSRAEFVKYKMLYGKTLRGEDVGLSVLEKAAMFFFLVKSSFNSCPGSAFSYASTSNKASPWRTAVSLIQPAHKRLQKVVIECLDYHDLISRYDSPETLFYLDPPYVQSTRNLSSQEVYDYEMDDDDHVELCNVAADIKGMCILSGYHSDIYWDILINEFDWSFKEIKVHAYSSFRTDMPTSEKPERTEVLWWNPQVNERTSQMKLFSTMES